MYVLILLLSTTLGECVQERMSNTLEKTPIVETTPFSSEKTAEIVDYKITGSIAPYVVVNVSFKKLPITVYLLDQYGGILSSKTVENIRELPIRLPLSKSSMNIFNETDVIRVVYNGQVVDERKIFIRGPKVEILKVYGCHSQKFGDSCLLEDVRVTVKNSGDAPAYVKLIYGLLHLTTLIISV